MPEATPESFGRFSMKLDLAIELAIAELPRIPGSASAKASRHTFMRWALLEGVSALAKHFEDGKSLNPFNWRFEIVQGPGIGGSHFKEYRSRAEALEKSLSTEPASPLTAAEDDDE
jgi:hypothetical protein